MNRTWVRTLIFLAFSLDNYFAEPQVAELELNQNISQAKRREYGPQFRETFPVPNNKSILHNIIMIW